MFARLLGSFWGPLVVCGLLLTGECRGEPFSSVIVFGDSLSDVGNIHSATFGLRPGSQYYQGRFSDGPVYAEVLNTGLGLEPLRHSDDGGNNFAYGGGRTSGTTFFEGGLFIEDLDEQVDRFLAERTADPNALYVVLAGGNDFVLGEQRDASVPADRIGHQLRRLAADGMQHLVSINLPDLGAVPQYRNDPNIGPIMTELVESFNSQLDEQLSLLSQAFPDLSVYPVDLAQLFAEIMETPGEFGITNVTDPGISAGGDTTGYLFWDELHPAKTAHARLGETVVDTLLATRPAGDFDRDGTLSPADVDLLAANVLAAQHTYMFDLTEDRQVGFPDVERLLSLAERKNGDTNFDGRVDFSDFLAIAQAFDRVENPTWSGGDLNADGHVGFPDFLLLSQNFGSTPASVVTVPEPAGGAAVLVTISILMMAISRPRRDKPLFADTHADGVYRRLG